MPSAVRTLDPSTGIADGTTVLPPRPETPVWQVVVRLAALPGRLSERDALGLVGASDLSRRGAMTRAAGEAIERSALRPVPAVDEGEALVTAVSPLDGGTREIPLAPLLYDAEALRPRSAAEGAGSGGADEPTPSGAAAGGSVADAAASALLELVERDALIVAWARRLALVRVGLRAESRASGVVELLRAPLLARGGDLVVADLGTDVPGVHAVVAVVTDPGTGAGAVGARAATDLDSAVIGASREAVQALHLARTLRTAGSGCAPAIVRTEQDRAAFWSGDEALHHLLRWTATFESPDSDSPGGAEVSSPVDPELVPELLERAGLHPLVVDLTERLPVAARELGWHVVKALCPELQPLRIDEARTSSWRHDRLISAQERTGFLSASRPGEVFDVPHPLV
ncbi:YcaO-like family protein [Rathayibacter sp. VKM Ac-2760]|uniref:YcaO-like family protein n=1 Tax=Rathayibacter sp. VKM Ac-2760 TaxID=2609253 RepID=UPI001ABDC148|nr:YcaO-like family protein [Rathayibacter sp. VKM Ac-2760]